MKFKSRTQGNVHGAFMNGQVVALVAFVHSNVEEISLTNLCDPANPHDSAVNKVYTTCLGNVSNAFGAYTYRDEQLLE